MIFADSPTHASKGHILAHSVRANGVLIKKGVILGDKEIENLLAQGVETIATVQIDHDDVIEDVAAAKIGDALLCAGIEVGSPLAGRVNLIASVDGILSLDVGAIERLNLVTEGITIATLANHARVVKGMLLATIKIIPYAVHKADLRAALGEAGRHVFALSPFQGQDYDLILTTTPDLKESLLSKGKAVIQERVQPLGMSMAQCQIVPHTVEGVAAAIAACKSPMVLILGACATSDRLDVIPASMNAIGGEVTRFGMPVDPGNLLVLGVQGQQQIVGLPGCARAPNLNGADWVLERLAAGIVVTSSDIAAMGVGGLLKEIPQRILPRLHKKPEASKPTIVLLAAGRSRRMGGDDKLLRLIDGEPLLRRSARRMIEADIGTCIVAIRKGAVAHKEALVGLKVKLIEVADADQGMSASLRAALRSIKASSGPIIVSLADMPDLEPRHYSEILSAYDPQKNRLIICPISPLGKRGHPVLFDARFHENLTDVLGDKGARELLAAVPEMVYEVPMDAGVTTDLDTPDAWNTWEASR